MVNKQIKCKTCGSHIPECKVLWFTTDVKKNDKKPYCDEWCIKWRFIPPEDLASYKGRTVRRDYNGRY